MLVEILKPINDVPPSFTFAPGKDALRHTKDEPICNGIREFPNASSVEFGLNV
jgi:hypothetical protein